MFSTMSVVLSRFRIFSFMLKH